MDIIHTICPICSGTNFELKQVAGFYHGFQICLSCKSIVGFKMIDKLEFEKEILMSDIFLAIEDCKRKVNLIESMTKIEIERR
jgi:hypothetical protein